MIKYCTLTGWRGPGEYLINRYFWRVIGYDNVTWFRGSLKNEKEGGGLPNSDTTVTFCLQKGEICIGEGV